MTVSGALATALVTGCGAHLQTWRPYTLSYPGLVGLAGAALADGSPSSAHLWAAWAVPTLSWIAGHYLGDYFDRDLDAIGKPQRPIPSGRLSPRTAVASGVLCAVAAAVVTALAAWPALLLVAGGMAGIVAYSKVFKGRGLSGNAVRGALTALTVVFGAMTAGTEPRWPAVLLSAVAFWAHDTASNLVGTLRDVDGDRSGGYRTLPVLRGVRYAARTAALLYAAALVIAASCVPLTAPGGRAAFGTLLAVAAACGISAFTPLLRGAAPLTPGRALRAHEVLVAERLILAAAVLSGGWGLPPALALLIPLLALSLLTQARLRARHEFPPDTPRPEEPRIRSDARPDATPGRLSALPDPELPARGAERHLSRGAERHLTPIPDWSPDPLPDSRSERSPGSLPDSHLAQKPHPAPDRHSDRRLDPAPDPHRDRGPDPHSDRPADPHPRPDRRTHPHPHPAPLPHPHTDPAPDTAGPDPERGAPRDRSSGADDPQQPLRAALRKDRPSPW
ncbi:UbiA family prenyltransferase [Streptomyces sp. NPDC021212]|uniref:UbiA family prenyltransferase n=1 Tax=Streptomyces sp. NPDC021212 TaxID=3365118 RepID=UPI003792F8A0